MKRWFVPFLFFPFALLVNSSIASAQLWGGVRNQLYCPGAFQLCGDITTYKQRDVPILPHHLSVEAATCAQAQEAMRKEANRLAAAMQGGLRNLSANQAHTLCTEDRALPQGRCQGTSDECKYHDGGSGVSICPVSPPQLWGVKEWSVTEDYITRCKVTAWVTIPCYTKLTCPLKRRISTTPHAESLQEDLEIQDLTDWW